MKFLVLSILVVVGMLLHTNNGQILLGEKLKDIGKNVQQFVNDGVNQVQEQVYSLSTRFYDSWNNFQTTTTDPAAKVLKTVDELKQTAQAAETKATSSGKNAIKATSNTDLYKKANLKAKTVADCAIDMTEH